MLKLSTNSRYLAALSELAQADRPLTFCELHDLVIPELLNIPEDVCRGYKCSEEILRRLEKFKIDVLYIRDCLDKAMALDSLASNLIKELLRQILDVPFTVAAFTDKIRYKQLDEVITKLKNCKPSHHTNGGCSPGFMNRNLMNYELPRKLKNETSRICPNPFFQNPAAFRRITQSYELLEPLYKACLLCFSAFPEDAEIKKRTVIYWWIGEELISPAEGQNGEETGHRILASLAEHGFIEDVIMKDRITSSCRVRPFIRTVLTYLANAACLFDYLEDKEHNDDGSKRRVCLAKLQEDDSSSSTSSSSPSSSIQYLRGGSDSDLECIHTLFNVNKCYLDIKLHWFWKMKAVKALYLGRCNSKAIQHIEVKSTKFLTGIAYMKELRLLSLQGISKIVKLPESISMARNLRILDLRDCNDMEELPEAVKYLENLTHLDLSGCYSLLRLPKEISYLSELQVLKGFLVRENHLNRHTCSFQDLSRLKKLKKLTISTSIRIFPAEEHLKVFAEMEKLCKLTIAWRGLYRTETGQQLSNSIPLPEKLEKLDLQHYPFATPPAWLVSDKLQKLRKLYIKGGRFLANLGAVQHPVWHVEVLRFKYLPQLNMTWFQLHKLFPHLSYLEQVKCPKLIFVPCNDDGVWLKYL